jgi:hypothetical protein
MKNLSIEVKWAFLFSLATLAWMFVEKSLGWHDEKIAYHPYLTNIFAVVAITIYVFALLDKRKNYFKGVMNYKQGFISGAILSLFVAILSPLIQYIINKFITPDYFKNAIDYSVTAGEMNREAAETYFNIQSYMIQASFGALLMGLLTAAVLAFFLKSKG